MFVKDALKRGYSGPFACLEGHLTAWIIHKLCTPTAPSFSPPHRLSRNNPSFQLRPHTSIKCGQIHKKMHIELLKRPDPLWFAAPVDATKETISSWVIPQHPHGDCGHSDAINVEYIQLSVRCQTFRFPNRVAFLNMLAVYRVNCRFWGYFCVNATCWKAEAWLHRWP